MAEEDQKSALPDRLQSRLRLFHDYQNMLRDEISTIEKQIYGLETTLLSQQCGTSTQISEGRSFWPHGKPINEKRIFSLSSVTSPIYEASGCEKLVKGVQEEEKPKVPKPKVPKPNVPKPNLPKPNAATVHATPAGRKRKTQPSARKNFKM